MTSEKNTLTTAIMDRYLDEMSIAAEFFYARFAALRHIRSTTRIPKLVFYVVALLKFVARHAVVHHLNQVLELFEDMMHLQESVRMFSHVLYFNELCYDLDIHLKDIWTWKTKPSTVLAYSLEQYYKTLSFPKYRSFRAYVKERSPRFSNATKKKFPTLREVKDNVMAQAVLPWVFSRKAFMSKLNLFLIKSIASFLVSPEYLAAATFSVELKLKTWIADDGGLYRETMPTLICMPPPKKSKRS